MNPVQRAFRTAALVKGAHPFALIVDDFQKDDKEHSYTWFANVPWKGTMEVVSKTKDSMVLKHKADANGPFLLVKVLRANGLEGIELNRKPNKLGKDTLISERVEITTGQVLAPDFQVLLYPYKKGEPMPKISGKGDGITVTIGDQIHNIAMMKNSDRRTLIQIAGER
jgi:hypothetical protein